MANYDYSFKIQGIESRLKAFTIRGGVVAMATQACMFALNMASTMVLARLLTPNDFGLLAMVSSVSNFVGLFKDMGLSMATVQWPEINHAQVSTLFWLNVVISSTLMLLFAAIAPGVAWFYSEPRLNWLMLVLATGFIFGGLTVQHQALLRRQMRFTALAAIEIISRVFGISTAIVSAWYGAGYWALVFMQLASGIVTAIGIWVICGWRPSRPVWHSGVHSMLVFGRDLTGFNIINYFARNLDSVLIGWYWGAQQLGLYSRAYQLLLMPIQQINAPIASVAVPALSRLQNDPIRYRQYYCKAMNLIAFLTTPLIIIMAVLSDEIIAILLGKQWLGASSIFKILAIAALGQPLANATGWVYISLGQTKRMMLWALISTPPLLLAFIFGLPWGALGVAIAYAITDHLRRLPLFLFAFRYSPIRMLDLLDAIWCPTILSLIMYAVMTKTHLYLASWPPLRIILGSSIAGFAALIISTLIWPRARGEVLSLFEVFKALKNKELS